MRPLPGNVSRSHVDTDVTNITGVPKLVSVFARESRLQSANAHCHCRLWQCAVARPIQGPIFHRFHRRAAGLMMMMMMMMMIIIIIIIIIITLMPVWASFGSF